MKIGIKIGKFINNYLKSYGTCLFNKIWIRRRIVCFISSIIAQVEFKEFKKMRCTGAYRDICGNELIEEFKLNI